MERMTWIKPSFLWMMYRSGWATKPRQERILAIDITRSGFEWALAHGCLAQFDPVVYASYEDWLYRAIQVGLGGEAVQRYVEEWITQMTDITDFVHEVHELVRAGQREAYRSLLPQETLYPIPPEIAKCLGITVEMTPHDHQQRRQ
jgi:hypothetical protein